MPCVSVSNDVRNSIAELIDQNPSEQVLVDIKDLKVRAGDQSFTCDLRPGARDSLLNGAWDPLDELLEANHAIESIHGNLAYT
jgi:3-isopropylmalate/(R)-2-methylmalate dehydratase small subunit